ATLFLVKLAAGLAANSLAILADATNSLLDLLSSVGVHWSVKESHKKADKGHPFGHARAEPMVAFVIAILMAIAAFEFFRSAVFNLVVGSGQVYLDWRIITLLLIAIVAKIILSHEAHEAAWRARSPALLATSVDSRNDVFITLTALIGVAMGHVGFPWLDDVAALIIAIFLLVQAYKLGRSNIDYLIGAAPPKALEFKIRKIVSAVRGVRGIHKIRSHYVGSYVHVEIHILVNSRVATGVANTIAMTVQHDVERLKEVNKAFVHIDPA
ncbi:cation transporter, partial [Candidatus Woesearchaeota archaeon]|nr:cation transporter [Candidatus Woesearchaeota archaeon]